MAVVGVGVCATSLKSLEQLFSNQEAAAGAAYLIAVRQQEGLDVAAVVEVLKRGSSLQVRVAADGEPLAPDQIYVGGPDDMITITDGHLRVEAATEPAGHRGTIDSMLVSLAEHAHERAVAVILAGLGSDGTAGVTATKKFGGLSIAELALSERGADLGGGVGPVAVVDLHLPIDKISAQIARYSASLALVSKGPEQEEVAEEIEAQITQVVTALRNVTGHDFHGYKRGTFVRRIQRRMQVMQIESVDAYLARLRSDRDEVQDLFQDLLIGVTQFFRDPAELEALERELPRLFEAKGSGDPFRVWVLGCATGEEAYSIAILLREHMATLNHPPEVQIFATDLDARALGLARAGRYAVDAIAGHVRPDRLERWFIREGGTYCVSKELREMCIFSPHNVVKDAPFSRVDILSCRNLLIYLNTDLQSRVIPIFHFSLVTGGVLFLGTSENVTRHQKLFAPVDRKNRVFRRLETATRVIPDFPLTPRQPGPGSPRIGSSQAVEHPARLSTPISRQAEAVAERYAPAYVVVDLQGDVLHFSGRTGRYLEPTSGAATLNLVSLVHRDLRIDLRSALQRAVSEARRIELPRLVFKQDDRTHGVNLIVEPVGPGDITSLVVVFQDAGAVAENTGADGDRLATDEQVQHLEAELRVTRDRLQATIEELESTNEELKSSNEEYQSINEELQSANEEMETSKEELQSINEELQTVNSELAHRVTELGHTNSDIKNLLEATRIATVFLDNDLRVRNFTPAATDIFHLLETDVGRPLDHVVSRVAYPELAEDARRVLKTLAPVERGVVDPATGRHFAARVLPYRSVDNYIGGAVVTFTDLTAVHQAEAAVRASEERLRALATASTYMIYRMSPDWQVMYQLSGRDILADTTEPALDWAESYLLPEDRPAISAVIDEAIRTRSLFELEHRVRTVDGGVGWVLSRAVPILAADGAIAEWFGAAGDITRRKEAEDALRQSEERLRQFGEASQDVLWIRDAETFQWEYLTPAFETIYGLDRASALRGDNMAGWVELIVPEDRERAVENISRVREGEWATFEYRVRRPVDGQVRWLRNTDFPIRDASGRVAHIGGIGHDVTALKETEDRLRSSEQRLRLALEVAHMGTWDWNIPADQIAWSDQHFRLEGYDVDEVRPSYATWADHIHPEDRAAVEQALVRARDERLSYETEFRSLHPDGTVVWLSAVGSFFYSDEGPPIRMIGVMQDVTERREWQERQKVLVAELQHRTRNLMGVVRSMAEKTARASTDLPDFRARFRDRLDALARVQGLLSRLNEHDRVTFDDLIRTELSAMDGGAERVTLDGPEGVRLRSSTVQTLAMALHELATNAVKYGALGQPQAHLSVTWSLETDGPKNRPWLHIAWRESDVTMPPVGARLVGTGQGRELIERALPYQLSAETNYTLGPDGVHCTISIPVSGSNLAQETDRV